MKLFGNQLANSLAGDLESINNVLNSLATALKTPPSISQLLLTNQAGEVTAAFGPVTFNGVQYNNFLSEIHVGDPLHTGDPSKALFNANLDGSVSIGQSGWLDVHDPWDGNAAWLGTQFETTTITGAANNGAGLIRLTIPAHTLATGNVAQVRNMNLVNVPNADGTWTVTVISATEVDLQGSIWSGPYIAIVDPPSGLTTYQPTIDRVLQISDATSAAGLIRIKTSTAHQYVSGSSVSIPSPGPGGVPNAVGRWVISVPQTLAVTGAVNNGAGLIRLTIPGHNYQTGDRPKILSVGGVPNANGYFYVTVINATQVDLQSSLFAGAYTTGGTATFLRANVFDLTGSTFAGAYTSGGTVLQYFAGMLAQTVAIGSSFQNYKLRAFPSGDLRISNATIELSAAGGTILLDPTTGQIKLSNTLNLSGILLDATTPSLTLLDQSGNSTVAMQILTEAGLLVTAATNAAPTVLTVPGNTYVNGDTVFIQFETGNTIINGYRIVQDVGIAGVGTFRVTPLSGPPLLNGNGAFVGPALCQRYYAGLLAETLALGESFANYKLRFFADGTLKINNAAIDQSVITNSSVTVSSLTSTAGTPGNLLTLTIANGVMTVSGTGTQAGNGNVTIDGIMESGELSLVGKAAAPTAPAAGKAFLYYDTALAGLRYNLGGAGWVTIGNTLPAGANTELQFNNAGVFGASASLTWNGAILTANALVASNGITVAASGISVTSGALVLSSGSISASGNLQLGGVTRLNSSGGAFFTALTMNGVIGYTGTVASAAGRNIDNGVIV